jgi:hypothetical protein
MKKYITLLPLMFVLTIQAQNNTKKDNDAWVNRGSRKTVFSLGINQWVSPTNTELSPLGSRYFAIAREKSYVITQNANAAVFVKTGFGISWNNYMFENNKVLQIINNKAEVTESLVELEKSKLTTSYLNLPLGLDLKFKKGMIQHIGIGTVVGLNLGSHTKTVAENGSKIKSNENLFVNKVRYGVTGEIGFRNSLELFVNYDLNQIFQQSKGPEATSISFGIRF